MPAVLQLLHRQLMLLLLYQSDPTAMTNHAWGIRLALQQQKQRRQQQQLLLLRQQTMLAAAFAAALSSAWLLTGALLFGGQQVGRWKGWCCWVHCQRDCLSDLDRRRCCCCCLLLAAAARNGQMLLYGCWNLENTEGFLVQHTRACFDGRDPSWSLPAVCCCSEASALRHNSLSTLKNVQTD
jgi:hypothetical protein